MFSRCFYDSKSVSFISSGQVEFPSETCDELLKLRTDLTLDSNEGEDDKCELMHLMIKTLTPYVINFLSDSF